MPFDVDVNKKNLNAGVRPALAIAVLLGIAACGGDSTEAADQSRCLAVPADKVAAIESGLVGGTRLRGARAVKSDDYEKVWMIAAELEGPSMEGDEHLGVWASNGLDASEGLILAVDGFAQEFSEWPDGDKTQAETSQSDDGVAEAKDCVMAALVEDNLPMATTTTEEPAPEPTEAPATTAPPTTPRPTQSPTTAAPTTAAPPTTEGAYYANCDEARAAGAAPIQRGEPGYRAGLDRDNDGVACDQES